MLQRILRKLPNKQMHVCVLDVACGIVWLFLASVVGKDGTRHPRMSHGCVVGCHGMRRGWIL